MKTKKVTKLLLGICSMSIITATGVSIAKINAKAEEPEMGYTSCVVDPDYEAKIIEGQQELNMLLNRQHYEKSAETLKPYETYGLRYDSEKNQLFYGEKSVCYFADNRATDGTFLGTEMHFKEGSIGVIVERDGGGMITGLKELNVEEMEAFKAAGWQME